MMRSAYKDPELAARAAYKTIERRLARGYWPEATVYFETTGINKNTWILHVRLRHDLPPRPSDLHLYDFEFPCVDQGTALSAMNSLHALTFSSPDGSKRTGHVASTGALLKKRSNGKK